MKKYLLALCASATLSFAGLIDGIALVVNDEPITLIDIQKKQAEDNLTKEQATSELVDEVLFNQLVKKNDITADIFDVNNYLEKVAAANGMDLYTFKSIIKQKYKDYSAYEENVKKQIIRQKLIRKIVRGKIKVATDEDLKIYYNNNKNMFKTATNIEAIQYSSNNKDALRTVMQNPMASLDNVTTSKVSLKNENLNPQIKYLVNSTNVNNFTPIFTTQKSYVTLLINKKEGENTLGFDEVKERIFNVLMQDREKKFLKEYFEKQKLSADITPIR